MARARNIKPSFFINDDLAELSPYARLLFIGLWTLADREGRLHDKPKKIKAALFPYEDINCDELLHSLADKKFIVRYQANDESCIQVLNFTKHQNPHKAEKVSEIPSLEQAQCKHGASTVQEANEHETNPADSLNLIPDILIPETTTDSLKQDVVISDAVSYFASRYPITSYWAEELAILQTEYSPEWVKKAIDVALGNNVIKLKYIKSTLKNWKDAGTENPWESRPRGHPQNDGTAINFYKKMGVIS